MTYQTTRFGTLNVAEKDLIDFPEGLLGFDDLHRYFIVDPADETMIMWLQSCDNPGVAFPLIEPSLVKDDYLVQLTKSEMSALRILSVSEAKLFVVLTIPENVQEMTANLKAPVVINSRERLGRQCVLQQNEYPVRLPAFKNLKARIAFQGTKGAPMAPAVTQRPHPTMKQDPIVTGKVNKGVPSEPEVR